MNPPFFDPLASTPSTNPDEDFSKRESNVSLEDWIEIAIKRCSVKGSVVLIHQAERLGQIMKCFYPKLGDIKILPISSFEGANANRVIVKGIKASLSPLKIISPLIMHEGSSLSKSGKSFTKKVEGILRAGEALNWD